MYKPTILEYNFTYSHNRSLWNNEKKNICSIIIIFVFIYKPVIRGIIFEVIDDGPPVATHSPVGCHDIFRLHVDRDPAVGRHPRSCRGFFEGFGGNGRFREQVVLTVNKIFDLKNISYSVFLHCKTILSKLTVYI